MTIHAAMSRKLPR